MDEIPVTGGADGLGLVIASALVDRRRAVVLVDRDEAALRRAAESLGGAATVVADLSVASGVDAAAGALVARGTLAGLVNNAGGWSEGGDQFPDAEPSSWQAAMTLNLLGPMTLTQRLWPQLAQRSGAVVNIGSSGGIGEAGYGSPEYGASKAGLRRLTASLGARSDVRVTCVVPGWIGLPRAHAQWATLSADEQREVGPLIPPEDVAAEVVRLLEEGRPGEVVEMLRAGERSSTRG